MCPPEEKVDPEQLAARYMMAQEDGDALDLDELASQLPDDSSRHEFRQLVEDAGALAGLLPVQVRPGVLLGGRYKVLREVGSGGMGKVFEADDTKLQRRVAVKVLATFGHAAFDPAEQFQREAQSLAALQHPNIVAIHEVGQDGDVSYMVMDLVPGQPLHRVIENALAILGTERPREGALLAQAIALKPAEGADPQPPERSWFRAVARLSVGIARTVESAHAHGLVHRDIKPRNILLRGDGTPVLLDFGLAGLVGSESGHVTRGLFGSPAYMAPEQAVTGQVGSDPRTDVYQLGTVLYELLTLRPAYEGKSVTDLLRRISMGDCAPPRTHDKRIPFELEAICLRAMETHPNRRYQTAKDFADDLSCYLDGSALPVAARSGRLGGHARRLRYAVRRHATAVLVAATVLIAVTATLIYGPWNEVLETRFFRWTAADAAANTLDQIAAGEGRLVFRSQSDQARPGDVLGVELKASSATFVYALSTFGDRVEPEWFAPMKITEISPQQAVDSAGALESQGAEDSPGGSSGVTPWEPEGEPAGRWGVRLPDGTSLLVCTQVGAADEAAAHEGLWVFTSPEPQPRLDAWMSRMARHPQGAASYDEAQAAFEAAAQLEITRGQGVSLTAEQLSALAVDFTLADMLTNDHWQLRDLQLHAVSFSVQVP